MKYTINNFMMNNKTLNKHRSDKNNDYLNFVRRNQQIVKEFKIISQLEKKGELIKSNRYDSHSQSKKYMTFNPYIQQKEEDIQGNPIPLRKDMRISLNYVKSDDQYNNIDTPILKRKPKPNDLISRIVQNQAKIQITTRNLSIPSSKDEQQPQGTPKSQIKLPKITNFGSKLDKSAQSESSLSLQREILSPNKMKSSHTITSEGGIHKTSKGRYVPIQLAGEDQSAMQRQSRAKAKNFKFTEFSQSKIHGKQIQSYYDYENLMELKEKVTELMPTFKPIQPSKRQNTKKPELQLYQKRLTKYLEESQFEPIGEIKHSESQLGSLRKPAALTDHQEKKQSKGTDQKTQRQFTEKNLKNHKSSESLIKNHKSRKQIIIPSKASENTVYQAKIQSYRDFLFMVNFTHRIYDPIILKDDPDAIKPDKKYKYYLGKGNNRLLVKSLMKRRFWWVQTDEIKEANFVWTQLKNNFYYQYQRIFIIEELEKKYDKLNEEHPYNPQKPKKPKVQIDNKKGEQKIQGGILRGQLPEKEKKIFTNADQLFYEQMFQKGQKSEGALKLQKKIKRLPSNFLKKRQYQHDGQLVMKIPHIMQKVHNHFTNNFEIGNKKALFYHLRHYYELIGKNPYEVIPLTFHVKKGTSDPEYVKFIKEFNKIKSELLKAEKSNKSTKKLSKNVWIVKPGEISNRGNGITVIDEVYQLNSILKDKNKHVGGQEKTYIVQKYIEKPLLYKNRKFDIRHYMMISGLHGRKRAYWFSEGYIRTSCYEYDLDDVGDVMIHLTNDAIQKNCNQYGKYEEGNKLSYAQFQRYLDSAYPEKKYSFIDSVYPRMREIALDAIKATYLWMDPQRLQHNFEIFGLDFMIDSKMNVWLIQINTNPCLQLSSGLLTRIIPTMLQHTFRLALDPIFPPTAHFPNNIKYMAPDNPIERLQYQLIFDEARDGKDVEEILLKAGKANCGEVEEEDEVYENDGKQIDIGGDIE